MARRIKELVAQDLAKRFRGVTEAVVIDYGPLNSEETRLFRKHLRQAGCSLRIVKNTLMRRVLTEQGVAFQDSVFHGMTGIVSGTVDAVSASKAVAEWRKKNNKEIKFKAGLLEGKPLDPGGTEALVKLPTVRDLRAMTVRAVASPLTSTVSVLANTLSSLPRILLAASEKKQKEGA